MRTILCYWTMLGLATQSSQLQRAMNTKLLKIASKTSQASLLEEQAAENQALAAEDEELATTAEAQGEAFQDEASRNFALSKEDEALAAEKQTESEALAAQAAEEESLAEEAFAVAEANEAAFDTHMAEGALDSAKVAELETETEGEEVGIALCEGVPFLDVLCDVIGGVTVVGTEVLAATKASEAAAEYSTAAAIKAQEEEELVVAGEQEAKALKDGEATAADATEATQLRAKAQEELAAAEEAQTMADEQFEQASTETESATTEKTEASMSQAESEELSREVVVLGVQVCWDAIVAGFVGLLVVTFFSIRVLTIAIAPSVVAIVQSLGTMSSSDLLEPKTLCRSLKKASYWLHHAAIFLLVLGVFGKWMLGMNQYELKARGGLILLFSLTTTVIELMMLRILPFLCTTTQTNKSSLLLFWWNTLKRFVPLFQLFVLEFLLLWVTLGKAFFAPAYIQFLGTWWLWIIFATTIAIHIYGLEILLLGRRQLSSCDSHDMNGAISPCSENEKDLSRFINGKNNDIDPKEGNLISERVSLLTADFQAKSYQASLLDTDDNKLYRRLVAEMDGLLTIHEGNNTLDQTTKSLTTLSEQDYMECSKCNNDLSPFCNDTAQPLLQEDGYDVCLYLEFTFLLIVFEFLVLSCMFAILRSCLPNLMRLWPASKGLLMVTKPKWPTTFVTFAMLLVCILLIWIIVENYPQKQNEKRLKSTRKKNTQLS